ncbi:MAG: response regulator transcription factor [Gammaproteobacteria bacterium]|nr:response regulator transcription factor [Gammaproteobacteria bacterium]
MQQFPTVHIVNQDQVASSLISHLLGSVKIQSKHYQSPLSLLLATPLSSPSCLLLDILLPEMSGLILMQRLRERGVTQPCIFLSSRSEPGVIIQMLNQGAYGFVKKPYQQLELLEIVQRALAFDQKLGRIALAAVNFRQAQSELNSREQQILELLIEGASAAVIGKQIGLSPRTVESLRATIMQKLQVNSLAQLYRYAAYLDTLQATGIIR